MAHHIVAGRKAKLTRDILTYLCMSARTYIHSHIVQHLRMLMSHTVHMCAIGALHATSRQSYCAREMAVHALMDVHILGMYCYTFCKVISQPTQLYTSTLIT